ncbi:MAG: F0F1 ATP synthase subunit delta [Pseudohongiellaceae bacterium]|nr:F0F1 ATP synthase subunit delta [Pseudohongiellaceae bacterium]
MAETITLARPYAKAAFDVALASNELGVWSKSLRLLAEVTADDHVRGALLAPSKSAAAQVQLLIDLCGEELVPKARNLIDLLAENKRLALLGDISALFDALKSNQEKTVDVELSTAFELNQDVVTKITQALQTRLNREIKLQTRVDKQLIGGAVIRAGDTVIDSSVRGKLTKLAEAMNS